MAAPPSISKQDQFLQTYGVPGDSIQDTMLKKYAAVTATKQVTNADRQVAASVAQVKWFQ